MRDPIKNDERGRYVVVRKEYPSGQAYYVFEYLEGDHVAPLRNGTFRIEFNKGTNFNDVKKFEDWLNRNMAAIAFTPD